MKKGVTKISIREKNIIKKRRQRKKNTPSYNEWCLGCSGRGRRGGYGTNIGEGNIHQRNVRDTNY